MVLYNRFPPSGQLYMHSIVIRSYDITKATRAARGFLRYGSLLAAALVARSASRVLHAGASA